MMFWLSVTIPHKIKHMTPTQCHLWQKEDISLADFDWEAVKTYWDSSHEWRHLMKCNQ